MASSPGAQKAVRRCKDIRPVIGYHMECLLAACYPAATRRSQWWAAILASGVPPHFAQYHDW